MVITTTILEPFVQDYPSQPVAETTFTLTLDQIINHPFSASSIYCDPWHPPCSISCLTILLHHIFPGPLWSTFLSETFHFIHYTFLHPIIVFFAAHAHTIITCFAVVLRLCHLFIVSLSTLLGALSFTLTSHIHLTILISAR